MSLSDTVPGAGSPPHPLLPLPRSAPLSTAAATRILSCSSAQEPGDPTSW